MILVIGKSGSGKSRFAEDYVCKIAADEKKYYFATMEICGEEGQKRVERHRKQREGKGFFTIEQQRDMLEVTKKYDLKDSTILLECLTNLVANEMFQEGKVVPKEQVADKIFAEILELEKMTKHLFLVSAGRFPEDESYDAETRNYMEAIYVLNEKIAACASEVIEVTKGQPVWRKGEATPCM